MSLRTCTFVDRLCVASHAGFSGTGLRLSDYRDARNDGLSDHDMLAMLADYELSLDEMEANWDWVAANLRPGSVGLATEQDELLSAARALGCPRINLASFFHHPLRDIVTAFGHLCDLTADDGVGFGLEFLPYAQISHLSFARQVVLDAARGNGKILLDTWHFFRSGSQLELLSQTDPHLIGAVQLNDVLPVPAADLKHEAQHRRQLPGEGAGALTELLRILLDAGFTGPLTVEVFSDALDDAAPDVAARRLAESANRVLDLVEWPH